MGMERLNLNDKYHSISDLYSESNYKIKELLSFGTTIPYP